jgi:RecA-family ATPase
VRGALVIDKSKSKVLKKKPRHRRLQYGIYTFVGDVTMEVAPGGIGKTSWCICVGIELASGERLLDEHIFGTDLSVLYITGEDDKEEIERRIEAIVKAYPDKHLEGKLDRLDVLGTDDENVEKISLLTTERGSSKINREGFAVLDALLEAYRPSMLVLDPLVAFCGNGNMNDNPTMGSLVKQLKRLALKYACSILVVHHTNKHGERGDINSSSGAAATFNMARRAIMPVPMTKEEAAELGVMPTDRDRYFRMVDAKRNTVPPPAPRLYGSS